MNRMSFSPWGAALLGTLAAGVLDIGAVFAFWVVQDVAPSSILQSIASSLLGPAAYQGGAGAVLLGAFLHFFVSFVFAGAYVLVALRARFLTARPFLFGALYGALAYTIMTFAVVPLSRAQFGGDWPPPPVNLAASLFIHLFLFGLPIAWIASRMRRYSSRPAQLGGRASADRRFRGLAS
jgi:uncharacterized membrane protein YagU involved in acid resistance